MDSLPRVSQGAGLAAETLFLGAEVELGPSRESKGGLLPLGHPGDCEKGHDEDGGGDPVVGVWLVHLFGETGGDVSAGKNEGT